MAGGGAVATGSAVEAPVTIKTYLMCAFAAFGGIFFGFDSGYINGVLGMRYFIETFEHLVSIIRSSIAVSQCKGRKQSNTRL